MKKLNIKNNMKLLTLTKKNVSIYLPIIEVNGKKIGPLPHNFHSILNALRTDSIAHEDKNVDLNKLLLQMKDAGIIEFSDGNYSSGGKNANINKDLLNLFDQKFRMEPLDVSKPKSVKAKPEPIKAKLVKKNPVKTKPKAKIKPIKAKIKPIKAKI